MGSLEVPFDVPRGCVQCDEGGTVEIRSLSTSAVKIGRGSAHWQKQHATLGVYCHETTCVGARPVFPLILLPGIVVGFTGTRNCVKCPDELSGVNVPGPDVATRSIGGIFLH